MRKVTLVFFLLFMLLLSNPLVTRAEFQAGVGLQSNNSSTLSGTIKLDERISDHWEIRGIYNSGTQVVAPGVTYFWKPAAALSPYCGIEINTRFTLVAGVEYNTSKWIPGTAVSAEIKGAPDDLANTMVLAVALQYTFPKGRTGQTGVNEASDQYLLAQLITAEASDEPYAGQVAVAAVVINRTKTPLFPKTIKGVIYEPDQFKPAPRLSAIKPTVSALKAAQEALRGQDPSDGALYFYNPATVSPQGLRFFSRLKVTARIGNHVFAK